MAQVVVGGGLLLFHMEKGLHNGLLLFHIEKGLHNGDGLGMTGGIFTCTQFVVGKWTMVNL